MYTNENLLSGIKPDKSLYYVNTVTKNNMFVIYEIMTDLFSAQENGDLCFLGKHTHKHLSSYVETITPVFLYKNIATCVLMLFCLWLCVLVVVYD